MNIRIGQIWRRINPMHFNEIYFPKRGWKVEIIDITSKRVVAHKVVEYNGEAMESDTKSFHSLDDFLSMYELDE